jgi:hypothetical protein
MFLAPWRDMQSLDFSIRLGRMTQTLPFHHLLASPLLDLAPDTNKHIRELSTHSLMARDHRIEHPPMTRNAMLLNVPARDLALLAARIPLGKRLSDTALQLLHLRCGFTISSYLKCQCRLPK